jgi:hypothetical protein
MNVMHCAEQVFGLVPKTPSPPRKQVLQLSSCQRLLKIEQL